MKLWPVLADTGRSTPGQAALNLLNAGWTATVAVPLPSGGWTVPDQALAIFIEAPWDQLNKLHNLVIELVDDDSQPTHFMPGPDGGAPAVRIEHQVIVAPVPGAPSGTPGLATVFLDLPAGSLWIPGPRRRYIWRISTTDASEEIGFWVQQPPHQPVIGGPSGQAPDVAP